MRNKVVVRRRTLLFILSIFILLSFYFQVLLLFLKFKKKIHNLVFVILEGKVWEGYIIQFFKVA